MEQPKFPDGKTAKKIAAKFETPCYVYDEASLVKQAKAALAFPNAFGLTVRYAMKAASNAAILKLFDKLGLHIDASSAFEVERAIRAGIDPTHISLSSQQLPKKTYAKTFRTYFLRATSSNSRRRSRWALRRCSRRSTRRSGRTGAESPTR